MTEPTTDTIRESLAYIEARLQSALDGNWSADYLRDIIRECLQAAREALETK